MKKEKDYSKNHPVPQKGDKIRITAVNTTRGHYWDKGDVIEVLDGKPDYCGKPGFCAFIEREYGYGDNKRTERRRVWVGPNSYDWKIIERDGKPFEEQLKPWQKEEKRKEYLTAFTNKILDSEYLLSRLTALFDSTDKPQVDAEETASKIVELAEALTKRIWRGYRRERSKRYKSPKVRHKMIPLGIFRGKPTIFRGKRKNFLRTH